MAMFEWIKRFVEEHRQVSRDVTPDPFALAAMAAMRGQLPGNDWLKVQVSASGAFSQN